MDKERFTPQIIAQIESSAVLSDIGIRYEREQGRIVIEPFYPECLSNSSYDLILGEYYFVREQKKVGPGILNIYDPAAPGKIWGEPLQAVLAGSLKEKHKPFIKEEFWQGIENDDRLILVPPQGVLLVHSDEFVGAKEGYTTMVRSRSTLERLGICLAISAGWGDVGFFNRWTFILTNEHQTDIVPLKVRMRFAQIVFMKCSPTEAEYVGRGKYQDTRDLEELMRSWKPEDMLPKALRYRKLLMEEND